MLLICNAFSLNMLNGNEFEATMWRLNPIQLKREIEVAKTISYKSYVGHQTTADIFTSILGIEVPMNRETLKITEGHILVGQYSGPRLEEGTKELPEGAKIDWWIVEFKPWC